MRARDALIQLFFSIWPTNLVIRTHTFFLSFGGKTVKCEHRWTNSLGRCNGAWGTCRGTRSLSLTFAAREGKERRCGSGRERASERPRPLAFAHTRPLGGTNH